MKTWIIKYHRPSFDGYVYDFNDKVMARNVRDAVQLWLNVGYKERADGTVYRPEHKEEWIYAVVEYNK